MRIRSIKPEFWRSQDVTALRRDIRLLFVGLWSYADDNGVGIDDYRQITADLFALEDDPIGARDFVRDGLATLSAASLIVRYEHGGKRYLYIPTWDRHQRVDKPAKPRYPRPDEDGVTLTEASTSTNADSPIPDATLSRHSRDTLAPGTGEQGNRGTGEQETDSSSPSARTRAPDDGHGSNEGRGRRDRGTRLPPDFPITQPMTDWAREHAPRCGPTDHEAFCDYWRAQPGAKGRKVDWIATWRNWMRREQERRSTRERSTSNNRDKPSTTDLRVGTAMALAAELRHESSREITA